MCSRHHLRPRLWPTPHRTHHPGPSRSRRSNSEEGALTCAVRPTPPQNRRKGMARLWSSTSSRYRLALAKSMPCSAFAASREFLKCTRRSLPFACRAKDARLDRWPPAPGPTPSASRKARPAVKRNNATSLHDCDADYRRHSEQSQACSVLQTGCAAEQPPAGSHSFRRAAGSARLATGQAVICSLSSCCRRLGSADEQQSKAKRNSTLQLSLTQPPAASHPYCHC